MPKTVKKVARSPKPVDLAKVREQIIALRNVLETESVRQNPNLWAETPGHEAAKRAILVASVQGHSILFIGPEADLCSMLAEQMGVAGSAFIPKVPLCDSDRTHLDEVMQSYDMHVEAPETPVKYKGRKGTTLEWVRERRGHAGKMTEQRLLQYRVSLEETARALFAMAVKECAFSRKAQNTIVDVAASIAALEGATHVPVSAIAEAVQYRLDRK